MPAAEERHARTRWKPAIIKHGTERGGTGARRRPPRSIGHSAMMAPPPRRPAVPERTPGLPPPVSAPTLRTRTDAARHPNPGAYPP
jgi:hypothetical protein